MSLGASIDFTSNNKILNKISELSVNSGHSTEGPEGYKEVTWSNGVPAKVTIWVDNSKAVKLWTRTYTFVGGVPTQVSVVDEVNSVTNVKTIVWQNGVPVSINKV